MGHFRTLVGRVAPLGWIVSAGLLAGFPCGAVPPGVLYSTTVPYTAWAGISNPGVTAVTTDSSGNSYITGVVYANGLAATPGVVQPTFAGGSCPDPFGDPGACADAFIAKFDVTGKLAFLTYLGGTGWDVPSALAVDAAGDIYVGGQTEGDFPLAGNPWRPVLTDEGSFIAKLSSDGKKLIWSTVLNGSQMALAVAPDGSLYALTEDLQTTAPVILTNLTGDGQLVANVNLPYMVETLVVAGDGSVLIGGRTDGGDVAATPGAWQTTFGGGVDGFAGKMNSELSGFAWLTFVGGSGNDDVGQMVAAADGSVWISGGTASTNFPVMPGAFQAQPSAGASSSGYLVHLSADGSKALAATYLPAALSYLALDEAGNAIVSVPYTFGQSAFQATPGAPWPCPQIPATGYPGANGFFGKIDAAGQSLEWGTWTGASIPYGPVAADKSGNAVVAGTDNAGDVILSAMSTVAGPPRLVASCVALAGYPYVSGAVAAGEVISIYGAGFGPAQGVAAQPSGGTVGSELGGVQVLIENAPAPLLYVSAAQINLVAPYLLDGRIAAHIKIVTGNGASNEVVLSVEQAAPEIFASEMSFGPSPGVNMLTAAIINQDNTVNSPAHPAHAGDTVSIYVSGTGQTDPAGVDGAIPTAAGGTPVLPITVIVTGANAVASVTYAGWAPSLVSGVTQVNFQVPSFVPGGPGPPYYVPVVVCAGGTCSDTFGSLPGPGIWFE